MFWKGSSLQDPQTKHVFIIMPGEEIVLELDFGTNELYKLSPFPELEILASPNPASEHMSNYIMYQKKASSNERVVVRSGDGLLRVFFYLDV